MIYDQLNFFDMTLPEFQIDKPIRLIELFAGIGSQAMALRDLGADFEHYRAVEFDRFAIASYNAIHGTEFEPTDITQISGVYLGITETDKYCYIMTYSFPCQDLSVAGKQKGMTKGSGTRSGLLWEVERLLNEVENLPQVLLMENVTQVHSKAKPKQTDGRGKVLFDKNGNILYGKSNYENFMEWIDFLESKGYSNYWQDLNAKDYGVAQNRNRCFMVSLLGEWNYKFPKPTPLKKSMKDYLEDEVDENYYINSEKARNLIETLIENGTLQSDKDFEMEGNFNQRGKVHGQGSICRTILGGGHAGNEPKVLSVGNVNPSGNGINGNVYAGNLFPSITTNKGEGAKICVDMSINKPSKKTVSNCIMTKDYGISNQKKVGNGVVEWEIDVTDVKVIGQMDNTMDNTFESANRVYDTQGIAPTVNTCGGGGLQPKIIVAMRGRNPNDPSDQTAGSPTEQKLEPNSQGVCNTITSVQKDNMVLECVVLTPRRTEYGKAIRKAYESGVVEESRHNMTELQPRTDSISNTITTVQKDNLVMETSILQMPRGYNKGGKHEICPPITSNSFQENNFLNYQYRIRKLTPLECWRLMGFSDEDFLSAKLGSRRSAKETLKRFPHLGKRAFTEVQRVEKMSNSQLYRQSGNSIVKNVLMKIFRKMIRRRR